MSVRNEVIYINTKRKDGIMSSGKQFFPEGMILEERKGIVLERKDIALSPYGISGRNVLIPSQDKKGFLVDATEMVQDFRSDNPNGDLYDLDVYADGIYISKNLKNILLAFPSADCPVLIVTTPNFIALTHCGAPEIDRELPRQFIESVQSKVKTRDDIKLLIGPHISADSYVYEHFNYGDNLSVWDGALTQVPEGVSISLEIALLKQLRAAGMNMGNIEISRTDTATNDDFYSNYMKNIDPSKNGRHLTGVAYVKRKH